MQLISQLMTAGFPADGHRPSFSEMISVLTAYADRDEGAKDGQRAGEQSFAVRNMFSTVTSKILSDKLCSLQLRAQLCDENYAHHVHEQNFVLIILFTIHANKIFRQ